MEIIFDSDILREVMLRKDTVGLHQHDCEGEKT